MDTKGIESTIARLCSDAVNDPDLHDLLAVTAERRGLQPSVAEIERGARFVAAYIEQVPYMMKVAWTAACNMGLEEAMRHILETVSSYWAEANDVIPDELGVIGLLDDAYCSLCSLQGVSDHFRLLTGKHLFPDDLSTANQAMRQVIGEPYTSELDRIVARTMNETGLVDAIRTLAGEEKRLNLEGNSTIWSHSPAGQADISDLLRLGIEDK